MDYRTDPRQLFDEVIATPDPFEFVRRAYRLVLRREASEAEVQWRGRLLKYVPFYTRDRFLRRLLLSPEAGLIGRATVAAGEALLQQGAVRDKEARDGMSAVEARLKALETWVGASEARVQSAEARLLAAAATTDARMAAMVSDLQRQAVAASTQLSAAVAEHATVGRENKALGESLAQAVEACRFEQRFWFDQLRRLGSVTAERTGALIPPAERPAAAPTDRCRVCGGPLAFRFRKRVLHDRYDADYFECQTCHTLQIPNPYWLAEAYSAEADAMPWNPDPGRFIRNFSVFQLLHSLLDAGLGGHRKRVLDFGGGYGLFTQMLYSAGLDAWGYDPYVPTPYLASDRVVPNPADGPAGAFDVVTALEVFEHLTDPAAVGKLLRHAVAPGGAVLLTTGIYAPAAHGPDWPYLSTISGQHVTLWSRGGLTQFAADAGFRSVGYAVEYGFPAVILSDLEPAHLAEVIAKAERRLTDPDYRATVTRGWVLTEPPLLALRGVAEPATPTPR